MDAALTGVTLALHDKWRRFIAGPDGPDSMNISGHKFFSVPTPCAMLLAHERDVRRRAVKVPYTASSHTTLEGSRDGHLPLRWWWTVHKLGGRLRAACSVVRRADTWRSTRRASQRDRLDCNTNPWGLTVAFKEPSEVIRRRHGLAIGGDGWARWIAMPGRTCSMSTLLSATCGAIPFHGAPSSSCADGSEVSAICASIPTTCSRPHRLRCTVTIPVVLAINRTQDRTTDLDGLPCWRPASHMKRERKVFPADDTDPSRPFATQCRRRRVDDFRASARRAHGRSCRFA